MKIALLGYGKMGRTIEELVRAQFAGLHEVVLRIDSNNKDFLDAAMLKDADVAIEFSLPDAAVNNILLCFAAGVPVVCGTTGWLSRFEAVKRSCYASGGALVYASNFSVGVNLFFELNRLLAQYMRNHTSYSPLIEETHHVHKKDAPSGTAITLAEAIIAESKHLQKWVNTASHLPDELPIVSHREDEVKGTHIVSYNSDVDSLEIKHTAHSRQGFALGAIMAAEWVLGRKGIFTMQDVLHLGRH